jgi:hypothetical protein
MKTLILTLALSICFFSSFSKAKHKAKPKPKPKHTVAAVIPADKSFASFSLQFAGGKNWQNFTSTDVRCSYGIDGYFNMVTNFKGGAKFEISYIASDRPPTPRRQLMRTPATASKYYIRFTQANHSQLYFSGYDLDFINTKGTITANIKLLAAEHNTMQSLHVRLMKK